MFWCHYEAVYALRMMSSSGAAISSGFPIHRTIPSLGVMINADDEVASKKRRKGHQHWILARRPAKSTRESFIKLGNAGRGCTHPTE